MLTSSFIPTRFYTKALMVHEKIYPQLAKRRRRGETSYSTQSHYRMDAFHTRAHGVKSIKDNVVPMLIYHFFSSRVHKVKADLSVSIFVLYDCEWPLLCLRFSTEDQFFVDRWWTRGWDFTTRGLSRDFVGDKIKDGRKAVKLIKLGFVYE